MLLGFDARNAASLAAIVDLRASIRREAYGAAADLDAGACWLVADAISERFDLGRGGGCYVEADGGHAAHEWNILPDGRIFDATADQFAEPGDGIRVTAANDPRYDGDCDCDGVIEPDAARGSGLFSRLSPHGSGQVIG